MRAGDSVPFAAFSFLSAFSYMFVAKHFESIWLNDPSIRHILIYNFIVNSLPALAVEMGNC